MHGYQIMRELGERSGGVWRPSPGSIYPTLQQLEDEELVRPETGDGGRRVFALTDAGREAQAAAAGGPAPWDEVGAEGDTSALELRDLVGQVVAAARQVLHAGEPAQIAQAKDVLREARRKLYRILAEDSPRRTPRRRTGDRNRGPGRNRSGLAQVRVRPQRFVGTASQGSGRPQDRGQTPDLAAPNGRGARCRQGGVAARRRGRGPGRSAPPRRYGPGMRDALPTARLLGVARGEEEPDVVIEGARVFGAFTREWLEGDVAIADGRFAGVGSYEGGERIDGRGRWLSAGFIDAHMHVESSKLTVGELARLLVARGTTTIVCDPHELANALGPEGVHWFLDACEGLPMDVLALAPACVPASPFESPRGVLARRPGAGSSRTSACSASPR